MPHNITLKSLEALTHDTNRYTFSRPDDLSFKPGQATALMLDREGWRDEDRPFTFTSQPEDADLEFVIKTYPDHDGVTEQLAQLKEGDEVLMTDPFGAITDQGPGTFIAAGAGITPFIPILDRRDRDDALMGSRLIFTNKTEGDIILRDKWEKMAGLDSVFTVTDDASSDLPQARVDKAFLANTIENFTNTFYLCGPQGFVDDVRDALVALGASKENIITEEGW